MPMKNLLDIKNKWQADIHLYVAYYFYFSLHKQENLSKSKCKHDINFGTSDRFHGYLKISIPWTVLCGIPRMRDT